MLNGLHRRESFRSLEQDRLQQALTEQGINQSIQDYYQWHFYEEKIEGLTLKTIAQNLTTYGGDSFFLQNHMVGNNVDHVFEPEQAEPIMDYFARDECPMPTVEQYRNEPWKLKWSLRFTHYPPKTGIKIQPSQMKFR